MDEIIDELIDLLNQNVSLDDDQIAKVLRKFWDLDYQKYHKISKSSILPYYLKHQKTFQKKYIQNSNYRAVEKKLIQALQVKPRRSASGVATITVMTKPWPCASDCIYCPNDLRMPKSYLSDEPVAQRAEQLFFDPYLQITSRLRILKQMGHNIEKIEIIILGGSWSDYPLGYQIWFIKELFRGLNESDFDFAESLESEVLDGEGDVGEDEEGKIEIIKELGDQLSKESNAKTVAKGEISKFKILDNCELVEKNIIERTNFYLENGWTNDREILKKKLEDFAKQIPEFASNSYLQNFKLYYDSNPAWQNLAQFQQSSFDELKKEQKINETAKYRSVGLVIETRPDLITKETLVQIRSFGATKIQMGIQSLNYHILDLNQRKIKISQIQNAFELLRIFGFKIHIHFMLNLLGTNPKEDIEDFQKLFVHSWYHPDELKLYPCVLVESAKLYEKYVSKQWKPYNQEELTNCLVTDTLNVPRYSRISRMIRDISAHDIVAGNKKGNLRQLVEQKVLEATDNKPQEIRLREINNQKISPDKLKLKTTEYWTSNTREFFLEFVTPEDKIAGFLRLSLPQLKETFPINEQTKIDHKIDPIIETIIETEIKPGDAMIREVHIYGKVINLNENDENIQHQGLGKQLIEEACKISRKKKFQRIRVISAIGTKEYYRKLGFKDEELYLIKDLV